MTEINRPGNRSRAPGLFSAAGVIALAAVTAFFWGWTSPERLRAIAFAAAVSLGGAVGAWFAGLWPATTPAGRVTASLATVALRIFPALVALAWLQAGGAELRAAGAGELLVIFYLAALAVEVIRTIMNRGQTA